MYAPLVVFTYNRSKHTEQILLSLNNSLLTNETDIFILMIIQKES